MATVDSLNKTLGTMRDQVYDSMEDVLTDNNMSAGEKSKALLDAQADLGITDGFQNIVSNGYKRWAQTGQ